MHHDDSPAPPRRWGVDPHDRPRPPVHDVASHLQPSTDVLADATVDVRVDDTVSWTEVTRLVREEGHVTVSSTYGPIVCLPVETFVELRWVARQESSRRSTPAISLTPREAEALSCIESGLSMASAAKQMQVSTNTVAQHLVNCRRKFGVHSSIAAVKSARNAGLL